MSLTLIPPSVDEGPALTELRLEVREFLHEQIAAGVFVPHVDTWLTRWDREFTRELGRRGWLGMTIPKEYGGHARTFLERFVVTEELLIVGAPVAAQWVADRQIGPSLLRFGTEEQKQAFLPGIAHGEVIFGIGMSEPDSGSDLASVRTRGEPAEQDGRTGWRVTGTKVWTSGAHEADGFFALARTEPLDLAHRHAGLSQFIVDLHAPGVEIRPIVSMGGDHHFNEVHLNGVFVPDDRVLGKLGEGWRQVSSELAFERSGPERFLSTFQLLAEAASAMDEARSRRTWGLAVSSRGSPRCTRCPCRSRRRWRRTRTPTPPPLSSKCSAQRPRATSRTTSTRSSPRAGSWMRRSMSCCGPRSCNGRDSPCGAAPTRSCAA